MITVLSSECLKVTINSLGAEIISVNKNGKELLWDGNPDYWTGHAPVLFPICGGLKDDKFTYAGKEYNLPKHGFAKKREFKLESAEAEKAVYLLCSDEESLKMYPFDFEFRIIYTLDKNKVKVEYNVKNLTDGEMYYSIGSHEAYACPGGIDEYTIKFEKEEESNGHFLIAGMDEVGRGPLAGPVCVACVMMPLDDIIEGQIKIMLEENMDIELICKISNKSKDDILNIKKNLVKYFL